MLYFTRRDGPKADHDSEGVPRGFIVTIEAGAVESEEGTGANELGAWLPRLGVCTVDDINPAVP